MATTTNGKTFTIPTLGCEGCEERKRLLTAGNWKVDALLVFAAFLLVAFLWKVDINK